MDVLTLLEAIVLPSGSHTSDENDRCRNAVDEDDSRLLL